MRLRPHYSPRTATVFSIAVASLIGALTAPVSTADAALITRNVNVTLDASAFQTFNLDLDLNGSTDFTFNTSFAPPDGSANVKVPLGSISNGVVIDAVTGDGFPSASRLAVGSAVGPASLFSDLNDQANLFSSIFGTDSGNFGGQSGFIGLRFDAAGGPLFGFAQVSVNGLNSADPFDLIIGAVGFNNVAGQAFAIPSAVVAAVPEPGSLSLLALAGFGLWGVSGRRKGRAIAVKDI